MYGGEPWSSGSPVLGWVSATMPCSCVDGLADPFEQRHEALERHRTLCLEHRAQRGAADELHRDPAHAIGLGTERIDVGRVQVIELRCQLGRDAVI